MVVVYKPQGDSVLLMLSAHEEEHMTRTECEDLLIRVKHYPGWEAWPARAKDNKVPLVWCTKTDGSTRIFHVFTWEMFVELTKKYDRSS